MASFSRMSRSAAARPGRWAASSGRHAVEEEDVGVDRRLREQRAQGDDRVLEAAGIDQRLHVAHGGGGRRRRRIGRMARRPRPGRAPWTPAGYRRWPGQDPSGRSEASSSWGLVSLGSVGWGLRYAWALRAGLGKGRRARSRPLSGGSPSPAPCSGFEGRHCSTPVTALGAKAPNEKLSSESPSMP